MTTSQTQAAPTRTAATAAFRRTSPGTGSWLVEWPAGAPSLSDVLPHFEALGFRVDQCITMPKAHPSSVDQPNSDMTTVHYEVRWSHELQTSESVLEDAFTASWTGLVEVDAFTQLVGLIGLSWQEVRLLRALARFLHLAGLPYSRATVSRTLIDHAGFTRAFVDWFSRRHTPGSENSQDVSTTLMGAEQRVLELLDEAVTLDADRVMRALFDTALSVSRTSYAQSDHGRPKDRLTLKIKSAELDFLPAPRPATETFVYSATMEGLHLRAGRVARGGLRWSDRTDDFRTEVLALMKAQHVKNALIVPAGAKGAFISKGNGDRAMLGRQAYGNFVNGLLDITDNVIDGHLVSPADTVVWDDPDPYLVVAADKGTATFSDLANSIAQERSFWLGDGFASGGSRGYDHKAMGITARGAWVSAHEHLHRLGINADSDAFTAVGIGDMSGDVFGNGVQLSPRLRLIAAFDHRHVFVDPNPDPEVSRRERARLATLPGSSWADYSTDALSAGGGIWSRSAKKIALSPEVALALGLPPGQPPVSAQDLIRAVLAAPVDLLYNGGVGTYIKSSTETQAIVSDPSNDAVRVDATQVRARVVVEGGNLGLTQSARVELALAGTAVNTDFIDNSAGVDTSDLEVNLKILLDPLVRQGRLDSEARDAVLRAAEDDVATTVLTHNTRAVQAITAAAAEAAELLDQHAQVILNLESAAGMDRVLEQLPDAVELEARRHRGVGLTRPEIAVLLAWSKILLCAELGGSELPDDPRYATLLTDYFPTAVRAAVDPGDLTRHRLAREIISTQVANALIDEVGTGFLYRMEQRTGATTAQAARAYVAVRDIFDFETLRDAIDHANLTHPYPLELRRQLRDLLEQQATRFVRDHQPLGPSDVGQQSAAVTAFAEALPLILTRERRDRYERRMTDLTDLGMKTAEASKLAAVPELGAALDTMSVARKAGLSIVEAAGVIADVEQQLEVDRLRTHITDLSSDDHWTLEAKAVLRAQIDAHLHRLAVVRSTSNAESEYPYRAIEASRYRQLLDHLGQETPAALTQITVAIDALGQLGGGTSSDSGPRGAN